MKNAQDKVRNWMKTFGQEAPSNPVIPSPDIRKLRAKLILEECLETIEALGIRLNYIYDGSTCEMIDFDFDAELEPDLTAIQDGCSDLHVVVLGTEVACGLNAEPAFNEVMRSNDSKLWTDDEVESGSGKEIETWQSIVELPNSMKAVYVASSIFNENKKLRSWLVKNSSGKVIKSPSYSKAQLAQFTTT